MKVCVLFLSVVCFALRHRSIGFHGGRETLRILLHAIDFSYVKSNGERYLREKPEAARLRFECVKKYVEAKQDYYFVNQNETWVCSNGTGKTYAWENADTRSCASRHSSQGEIGFGNREFNA